jgi:flagellar hook-associated protein 1 FlgK
MINSYQSLYTITNGLILQQLQQEVNASNIGNPSQDANGYLLNSLQRVNAGQGAPLIFGGANGNLAVGTGPNIQSITRLRDSFLDTQIQNESSTLGFAEVLANSTGSGILNQINAIVNGANNLNNDLTAFATAWGNLSATPLNTGLRAAVVNAGSAFAQDSHTQFSQLESLQYGLNGKIQGTVSKINGILQQIASINKQLLNSQGANVNSLLDARDYSLDLLSRLINIQTNFGPNGTVDVTLAGSNLSFVEDNGAAILQANLLDPHNPGLVDISLQSPEGMRQGANLPSVSQWITGGNLGGELYARNVTLESYKYQVDQIATSVMNVTNNLHSSGYAANGTTTGTLFFTGTGAGDISVNASLISDPTHALLAASALKGITADGQIAIFLGNLPNILADNFIESNPAVNSGLPVNPTAAIGGQPFALIPSGGQFQVNGVTITYTTANTVDDILNLINSSVPNVYAVFNETTQLFYMYSNNPIVVTEVGADNFTAWGNIHNALTSSVRVNNAFAPTQPLIVFTGVNSALNSNQPAPVPPATNFNHGPNTMAYRVTPSTNGTFTIDGIQFNWNNTQSLAQIRTMINTFGWGAAGKSQVSMSFNAGTQTVTLLSSNPPTPIQIVDNVGNFTVFTGLDANTPISNLTSGILTQSSTDLAVQQMVESQASDSLKQLNAAQANIAGVSTSSSMPGVPVANIQQQAMQDLITYNAMLQVLQVIDQMYSDLVSIAGSSSSSSFFQKR